MSYQFNGELVGNMPSKRAPGLLVHIRECATGYVVGYANPNPVGVDNLRNWTIFATLEGARKRGKELVGE